MSIDKIRKNRKDKTDIWNENNPFEQYVKIPRVLFESQPFDTKLEKLVLINMYYFADREGYLYPSAGRLAKMCNCSRSSIFPILNSLEEKGYITIHRRTLGKNGKKQTTNIYKIHKFQHEEIERSSAKNMELKNIIEDIKREDFSAEKDKIMSNPESELFNPDHLSGQGEVHEHNSFNIINVNTEIRSEDNSSENDYDYRNSISESEFDERLSFLKKIHKLVHESTGVELLYVENGVKISGLSLKQVKDLYDRILESDFLMGKLRKKPTLRHFSQLNMVFQILGGVYKNRIVPGTEAPCYEEFPENMEEVNYEPIY